MQAAKHIDGKKPEGIFQPTSHSAHECYRISPFCGSVSRKMEKKTERPFITSRCEGAYWPALKRLYSRKFLYMSNDDDDKDGWAREALSQTRVFGAEKKGGGEHMCARVTRHQRRAGCRGVRCGATFSIPLQNYTRLPLKWGI